jgi:hypothetical protein
VFVASPETARLLERLRDLREADARLTELRRRHLPAVSKSAPPEDRT